MIDGGGIRDVDFFISYTQADRQWAEWIAWTLEEAGYRVLIHAWDLAEGANWASVTAEGVQRSARTIAVLSASYAMSQYGAAEWQAAWAEDPTGQARKLLVVRVEDCDRPALLRQLVSVDLFGVDKTTATTRLLDAATYGTRHKPNSSPNFPSGTPTPEEPSAEQEPAFLGVLPSAWNAQVAAAAEDPDDSPVQRVFLCHSSEDKDKIRDLHRRLRRDGMHPWLDEEDILPGQDWEGEIRKAIKSSRYVLVCLSKGSIIKRGYLQKEIRQALSVAEEQPEGSIFLIPVRLEPCEVPSWLDVWQWVDLFSANGYKRLLRSLREGE